MGFFVTLCSVRTCGHGTSLTHERMLGSVHSLRSYIFGDVWNTEHHSDYAELWSVICPFLIRRFGSIFILTRMCVYADPPCSKLRPAHPARTYSRCVPHGRGISRGSYSFNFEEALCKFYSLTAF